jgi:ubiquinone/menaquinone biosynthesis C-methylase UbiE
MGWYTDRVLPRLVDLSMRRADLAEIRARVAAGFSGELLEVGFGSGINVPFYPAGISRALAVEPAAAARRLAAKRLAASPVPVEFVALDGQDLPLPDSSVDNALTTWTLCTIPDADRALAEIRRVLRPGGALHFAEHGRSPDARVARWQDRLTPLQRRVTGGCHLNRPIADLVTGAGLELASLENYYMGGPKAFGYIYEGVAITR